MVQVKDEAKSEEQNGDHPLADNDDFKKCRGAGLSPKVAEAMVAIIDCGLLAFTDLESKTLEPLKMMKEDAAVHVLEQFKDANLTGVTNHAAYLGAVVKAFRERVREHGESSAMEAPVVKGPDADKLQMILNRTGYPLEVSIGQRKYGPPPDSEENASGAAEIYVGHLPKDVWEDELIELFEECGSIFDLRLMIDPLTMLNKGYAFVTYVNKEDAAAASQKYEGHEIRPGKTLKVNVSMANTRLFVGNVPKTKTKDEILTEFREFADNISDLIVYPALHDPTVKNRGFCFVDFADHKSASSAKRALQTRRARPFGREVIVDWAEPLPEQDEAAMSKVKALYVRPLAEETTEEKLKTVFEPHGEVESVKKIKNYAFVHFKVRDEALKAVDIMNGVEIDGSTVEVSMAKPHIDRATKDKQRQERERRIAHQYSRGGFRGRGAGGSWGRGGGAGFGNYGGFGGYDDSFGYGYGGGYDPYSYGGGFGDFYGDGDMYGYGGGFGGYGGYDSYGYGFGGGGYEDMYGYGYGSALSGKGSSRGMGFRGRGRGGGPSGFKRKADDDGNSGGSKRMA